MSVVSGAISIKRGAAERTPKSPRDPRRQRRADWRNTRKDVEEPRGMRASLRYVNSDFAHGFRVSDSLVRIARQCERQDLSSVFRARQSIVEDLIIRWGLDRKTAVAR